MFYGFAYEFAGTAMTIFRLKQLASTSAHKVAGAVRWNYDRAELIADGVVHGIGVFGGLIAATVLVVLTAVYATGFEVAVVSVYVAGLLAMLAPARRAANSDPLEALRSE